MTVVDITSLNPRAKELARRLAAFHGGPWKPPSGTYSISASDAKKLKDAAAKRAKKGEPIELVFRGTPLRVIETT